MGLRGIGNKAISWVYPSIAGVGSYHSFLAHPMFTSSTWHISGYAA